MDCSVVVVMGRGFGVDVSVEELRSFAFEKKNEFGVVRWHLGCDLETFGFVL